MRLLIAIVLALLLMGPGESLRVGGTAEKAIPLGSLTQNDSFQGNISEKINATNQTNITAQYGDIIDIKSPMSIVPAANRRQGTAMPDSILANFNSISIHDMKAPFQSYNSIFQIISSR